MPIRYHMFFYFHPISDLSAPEMLSMFMTSGFLLLELFQLSQFFALAVKFLAFFHISCFLPKSLDQPQFDLELRSKISKIRGFRGFKKSFDTPSKLSFKMFCLPPLNYVSTQSISFDYQKFTPFHLISRFERWVT